MNRTSKSAITATLAVLALCFSPFAWSKSDQLPSAISSALQKAYPGAEVTQVTQEVENGMSVFDVEIKQGAVERDLIFSHDGTLIEAGEHIAVSALPSEVTRAIQNQYPNARITAAERKTGNGPERFDVKVEENGSVHELVVTPTGQITLEQDDQGEEEDESGDDD